MTYSIKDLEKFFDNRFDTYTSSHAFYYSWFFIRDGVYCIEYYIDLDIFHLYNRYCLVKKTNSLEEAIAFINKYKKFENFL